MQFENIKRAGVSPGSRMSQLELLALSNPKHLSPTNGADALGGRPLVLHSDDLGVLHLSSGFTLHTRDSPWSVHTDRLSS